MILLGAIADDFTGASDLANTLTRQGMRTMLFNGIPDGDADCEAAVIALKTRSVPADQAVARSVQALRWLDGQGVRQVLFKYCSTFDSTPEGNIGPVADALLAATGARTAVVCPAFPGAGRTIYAGHLFVNGVPLHESGMQHHPLNPMTDPDLRRWLELQAETPVDWLPWEVVHQGAAAIRARLEALGRDRPALVVVDALTDDDLMQIGAALDGAGLITGGSGIALGLPANFRRAGLIGDSGAAAEPIAGPGCALSGSCSAASRAQVADHAAAHPAQEIDVAAVMAGDVSADVLADWAAGHRDDAPILYSTAAPEQVAAAQDRYGRTTVSDRLERLMGDLALALWDRGFRRIAVGGGETSGAVIEALGVTRMRIGAEIAPGVPAVYADREGAPLGLALKSGNFGGKGFYDRALDALGGK